MPSEPMHLLLDTTHIPEDTYKKIYLQLEPQAIAPFESYLIENYQKYTYILTFNENVLKACPNALKYAHGTAWITLDEVNQIKIEDKQYQLSSVFGNKLFAPGHQFRREVFLNRDLYKSVHIPCAFFLSCNADFVDEKEKETLKLCHPDTKLALFKDSQFHLVIENSKQTNYFTEKLLDALITFTIPVYYGCPNIGEYFDTTGWIILDTPNVSELHWKIMALDEGYYQRHMQTVLENQKRAVELMDLYTNLNRVLVTLPEFKKS
jgi:hypothetical protein